MLNIHQQLACFVLRMYNSFDPLTIVQEPYKFSNCIDCLHFFHLTMAQYYGCNYINFNSG